MKATVAPSAAFRQVASLREDDRSAPSTSSALHQPSLASCSGTSSGLGARNPRPDTRSVRGPHTASPRRPHDGADISNAPPPGNDPPDGSTGAAGDGGNGGTAAGNPPDSQRARGRGRRGRGSDEGGRADGGPRGGAFRRFREQTYDVFRPQPTLPGALAVLGLLFALGLGLGIPLLLASLRVVEIRIRYDNADPLATAAGGNISDVGWDPQRALWASGDDGVRQSLTLTVPRAMRPPIFVMYELEGLYGTHKRYVRSASWEQLKGGHPPASSLDICQPRVYLGGRPNASLPSSGLIHPCGLRATSLFNDTFALEADAATCGPAAAAAGGSSGGVSGASGGSGGGSSGSVGGRRAAGRLLLLQHQTAGTATASLLLGRRLRQQQQQQQQRPESAALRPDGAGRQFAPLALDEQGIKWPLEVRHLYGMYNATNLNSVPALRTGGGLDEPVAAEGHFQVWMRPSARPTALKLYGVLHEQLPAGCVLRLHVANRYNSYGWGGAKRVVLTTQSWYGMRNLVVPCALLAVAAAALASAALLLGLSTCLKRAA
ncbi:hypothetical protein PLESTM_000169500 [Pleodorina starrii]|nr:hypothetical protein PLESTM_000169500 [Pleodorina starrii]